MEIGGPVITARTNEFQGIDLEQLESYWKSSAPITDGGKQIKNMHLELLDLVRENNFLGQVEEARRDLANDAIPHEMEVELDPETVLPGQQ